MKKQMKIALIMMSLAVGGSSYGAWRVLEKIQARFGTKLFATPSFIKPLMTKSTIKNSLYDKAKIGVLLGAGGWWFAQCLKSTTITKAPTTHAASKSQMWHDIAIISKVL